MYAPPTMMIALKRSMKVAGDFFDEKGWWYAVEAGASLGAVKVDECVTLFSYIFDVCDVYGTSTYLFCLLISCC